MSWIRSSKGIAVGVLFVVALAAVGTAAAISVSGNAPSPTAVGEDVQMSAAVEDPFDGPPDQYTLRGETELENASWTINVLNQGEPIETFDANGESFSYDLNVSRSATDVEIQLSGVVPDLETYTYDNKEEENYDVLRLMRVSNSTTTELDSWSVHRYTEKSREARNAIAAAESAVAESDSQKAADQLSDAKAFYSNEEFDRAITNAETAKETAESAQEGGLPIVLIGGAVVLLLVIIVGGYVYFSSGGDEGYKLQ